MPFLLKPHILLTKTSSHYTTWCLSLGLGALSTRTSHSAYEGLFTLYNLGPVIGLRCPFYWNLTFCLRRPLHIIQQGLRALTYGTCFLSSGLGALSTRTSYYSYENLLTLYIQGLRALTLALVPAILLDINISACIPVKNNYFEIISCFNTYSLVGIKIKHFYFKVELFHELY